MAESKVFCMDCMEALKTFPNKFFDLAVVDPPYGDGTDPDTHTARELAREAQVPQWNRFGERFDRYKQPPHTHTRDKRTKERPASTGLVGAGQRSSIRQKNHNAGRRAGAGILQGAVSRLTQPNHLGRKLFCPSSYKMLFGVAQITDSPGRLFYGAL